MSSKRLKLRTEKTYIGKTTDPLFYLGYAIHGRHVSITKESQLRMRSKVNHMLLGRAIPKRNRGIFKAMAQFISSCAMLKTVATSTLALTQSASPVLGFLSSLGWMTYSSTRPF